MLTYNRRLDLKQKCIDKLETVSNRKFPILRTNKLYFEKPIGEISAILRETPTSPYSSPWNVLIRTNGTRVFPRAVDGKYLIEIIEALQSNRFFSYIDREGEKCKIRPKIRNGGTN
jgi:hypothetical protein